MDFEGMKNDMTGFYMLDADNKVVQPKNWIEFSDFEKSKRRLIKKTNIGNYCISTVFLGINHGMYSNPLWFETMVFDSSNPKEGDIIGLDIYCDRCKDYQEAFAMHELALEFVREKIKNDTQA